MKFPIGGKVRERSSAGFGEIPKPTVTVWMKEDVKTQDLQVLTDFRKHEISSALKQNVSELFSSQNRKHDLPNPCQTRTTISPELLFRAFS